MRKDQLPEFVANMQGRFTEMQKEMEGMTPDELMDQAVGHLVDSIRASVQVARVLAVTKNDSKADYQKLLEYLGMSEMEAAALIAVHKEYQRLWSLGYEGTFLLKKLSRQPAYERYEDLYHRGLSQKFKEVFGVSPEDFNDE